MSVEDKTMRTSRILLFSPTAVYAAFSSPELLAQWWGPEGFSNTFEVFEFKAGGQWKFVMHGPDGKSYPNESVFAQLEHGSKIVIEHVCAPLFTLTVKLDALADGTHLSWEQVFVDEVTAQAVRHIVEPANEQNLDRLTRVLTQAKVS
ncbi:SRPBCC domain-containing protein [Methylophilus sp.]|uniref:SRPBCC domain-containing protein n=1 Tax=Methylophilus sp. TaxID=29541 RepID=UPI000D4FE64D|nr:SRPBCC domain-containing protein [Methylophilus sp.]PPD10921.1 MAG: polyketide cyclase [Methylophilus sp.]